MADRARFERMFREHYSAIAGYCLRRLPEQDAHDTVADVFTTTWERLGDVDEQLTRAWLFGVARNKVAHRWRANGRRLAAMGRLAQQVGETPGDDPASLVADADLLTRAAQMLSDSDLELLQLISWEGLGPIELGVVLGCSPGTATVRVHRMRTRLQAHLDGLQSPASAGNEVAAGAHPAHHVEES